MAWLISAAFLVNCGLALFAVVSILRQRWDPPAMLAWILAVLAIPFVGVAAYFLLGGTRIRRKASRRRRRVAHLLEEYQRHAERRALPERSRLEAVLPADLAVIETMGRRVGQMPATPGNAVSVYEEANATYAALESSIAAAGEHIHLLYYIWQPDETGRHFRDLLIRKARQGVECRVLLDAVGCLGLRRSFTQPMIDAGVQVAFFMPLYPLRKRWTLHLRNHRKIAVIDGRTAFVGSQNIGDEYRGRLARLSPWYDSHMRIAGPAVLFLQQIFAEDWFLARRESLSAERYFPSPQQPGESIVQILASGPDQSINPLEQLIFAAVGAARQSVRIATPYFVPDPALRVALVFASCRGVRVQIVIPVRTDAPIALWAARSYYAELLEAGIELYEFNDGVLHSKIITVDDRWCMLGSANMDVRSFRLNFEITAAVYDQQVTRPLSESIDRRCAQSCRISQRDVWGRSVPQQMLEGAARLFAPMI